MDFSYLIEWGHMYYVHFGGWVTFMIAASVHRDGIDSISTKTVGKIMVLSVIASMFSSHAHSHYLDHFVK